MSLDTKYRPLQFGNVIGQDATVSILRQFVIESKGFQQSYLFAGPKGCGKTTLGRILARALLCDDPVDGNPCDECESCKGMLSSPICNDAYTEMDAATNSGKDNLKNIVEAQQYSTFSGKKRLYLIDEAHQLSPQAMDCILKSLEDTIPGSDDRVLVCIFCTTEPDKVKGTISSRCAPKFMIRQVIPDVIAKRCAEVCDAENIKYELEALVLIAEVTGCHFRDALNAVAGVSMLGEINRENVGRYLNLGAASSYLKILASIGSDPAKIVGELEILKSQVSPPTCYAEISAAALTVYNHKKLGLGNIPMFWNIDLLEPFVGTKLDQLLEICSWLSKRPLRATASMLMCDLLQISQRYSMGVAIEAPSVVVVKSSQPVEVVPTEVSSTKTSTAQISQPGNVETVTVGGRVESDPCPKVENGVYFDQRCVRKTEGKDDNSDNVIDILDLDLARRLLRGRLKELSGRSSRRYYVGHN